MGLLSLGDPGVELFSLQTHVLLLPTAIIHSSVKQPHIVYFDLSVGTYFSLKILDYFFDAIYLLTNFEV